MPKKFNSIAEILHSSTDVLLISETKTNSSFPAAHFTTYRLNRNSNGGGIPLYVKEDISSTLLNTELFIEGFCIETNIRKQKWLYVCTYNPNKNLFQTISKR